MTAVLVGGAIALAGCGSEEQAPPAAPARSTASGTASNSDTLTTPEVATPAAPSAADGTRVAACADGTCEVSVRPATAIPVPKNMSVEAVRVASIAEDAVTITGRDIGNRHAGACYGSKCDSSASNGSFTVTIGVDSTSTQNGLSITVVAVDAGAAVLRLAPA